MKQNLLLVFLLNIIFSVTAQTDTITPAKTKASSIAIINTMDGRKIKGWLYKTDTGTVYLLPTRTKALQPLYYKEADVNNPAYHIDASKINTIALKKKNAVLKGTLIGLGIGAAIGTVIGFASGDDPVTPYSGNAINDAFVAFGNSFAMTAGEKAAYLGVAGGLTGALIGGITGALLKKKFIIGGKKDAFRISQAELNKQAMVKF